MKTSGFGTKLVLILFYFIGLCMVCNIAIAFEETEVIEGIVEHTYVSGAANGVKPITTSKSKVPMCRVVWYDKDGKKVTYGMPNDKKYTIGDSYFVEVDKSTNRIPKTTVGEGIAAASIGVIIWVVCTLIWWKKFGKKKKYDI